MGRGNFSDEFKRDAVRQIGVTARRSTVLPSFATTGSMLMKRGGLL
jgi:hypothetical protein